MKKKIVLMLLMTALLTGGVFAQIDLSAGAGGNFGLSMTSVKNSSTNPKPIVGGGFYAFFDADYAMVKAGLFIGGNADEIEGTKTSTSYTYLSLGLLGRYPIVLGDFTVFPMLGFEYNIFLGANQKFGSNKTSIKRSDLGNNASDIDMFILQLGVGADFNVAESIYVRPSLLWGIDFNNTGGSNSDVFKHKLDIGVAVGYRF